jgi:class 3 adenylate cyclase
MKDRCVAEIVEMLQPGAAPSVRELHEVWDKRQPVSVSIEQMADHSNESGRIEWLQSDVALAVAFVKHCLANDEFLLVCDAFREAFGFWNRRSDAHPHQLAKLSSSYAAAKARLGQTGEAIRCLEPWSRDDRLSRSEKAEILLQLGDIVKEECDSTDRSVIHLQSGEYALQYYQRALTLMPELVEAYIRSATMAVRINGNGETGRLQAEKWAHEALSLSSTHESEASSFRFCLNKAECLVVLGRFEEASEFYSILRSFHNATTAELAEARRDSERLVAALGKPADYFRAVFPPLQLIVFAGHMPDKEGEKPRFPANCIPQVRHDLRKILGELQARTALVSGAAGADLLFIEALMERPGAKFHLVLPWSLEEFIRTSVEPFDQPSMPARWRPLFERAVRAASSIRQLGQLYEPGDEVSWQYAEEVSIGLAQQIARRCRLDVQPLALWDRNPGRGAGGTASFCECWQRFLGIPPIVVDLPSFKGAMATVENRAFGRSERSTLHREVKTMLFADIVGYSRLTEKSIREYLDIFLARLSKFVAESSHSPICIDMWGDAVYAVFDFATDAGLFATQLTSFVENGMDEWVKQGLYFEELGSNGKNATKRSLNVRIGLHTGPVLAHHNHVIRKLSYTGSHVTRAARIEQVAEPGEVYASEEFAAMVAFESGIKRSHMTLGENEVLNDFKCEYAGNMSLAKRYPGRFPIYRVVGRCNLPLEQLAIAAHSLYCADVKRSSLSTGHPTLLRWEQLPEDVRRANRWQVADIPYKLSLVGYELTTGHGELPHLITFSADEIERLAKQEHDRWRKERERMGWRFSAVRDNARKLHPSLVAWEYLQESEREKDRAVIRNIPKLLEIAGLRVRRQLTAG